jgi:hypothetical protein
VLNRRGLAQPAFADRKHTASRTRPSSSLTDR